MSSETHADVNPLPEEAAASLYTGEVVHVRIRPTVHRLSYRMTALAIDVDRIDEVARTVRGFSYNRPDLVSLLDRDHGDGTCAIAGHARDAFVTAGFSAATARIVLVTYPRILGYAFNPVSVYYGYDAFGALGAITYEVNNTFGERKSYVVAAGEASGGVFRQTCRKEMSVSPFTGGQGTYRFHVTAPADRVVIGIQFHDGSGPIIRTHFQGCQAALTSTTLARQVLTRPWLAAKVTAAIHFEAARLFLKGVPLISRHRSPPFSISHQAPDDGSKTARSAD
ncbi:MAG: DUF1365 domain-containing protein [Pseudomonadota bacterium]